MKPVAFGYVRPGSLAEACRVLASDPEARPIAGGQTLVPMLAMRLARPTQLVDLASLVELSGIVVRGDVVEIGAMTRQAAVERDVVVARDVPLLARAIGWVGHAATRAFGTIGGSIANADPSAEIPLVAVALGADILTVGPGGDGSMAADAFFLSAMTTSLPPGSLVRAVRFPVWRMDRVGVGFAEINSRSSDFAFAAAAAQLALSADGAIEKLVLAVGGATEIPTRLDVRALIGARPDEDVVRSAIRTMLSPLVMMNDPHASATYRRRATEALAVQAVMQAAEQASGGGICAGHA